MARAYTVLANGGYLLEPYFIARIEDIDGNVLCVTPPFTICRENCPPETVQVTPTEIITVSETPLPTQQESKTCEPPLAPLLTPEGLGEVTTNSKPRYASPAIPPRNAWVMTSLLKDVIQHGTATQARQLKRTDIAGKTGTTNEARDAWFVGYTPDVVTATWVGFDKPRSLGYSETGGKAALPMWITFMQAALKDKPIRNLPMPTGVTAARIDPASGLLTNTKNPKAKFETFYSETVPKKRQYRPAKPRPTVKLRPKPQENNANKRNTTVPEQLF
jgi:penicillin-binding protein 1A